MEPRRSVNGSRPRFAACASDTCCQTFPLAVASKRRRHSPMSPPSTATRVVANVRMPRLSAAVAVTGLLAARRRSREVRVKRVAIAGPINEVCDEERSQRVVPVPWPRVVARAGSALLACRSCRCSGVWGRSDFVGHLVWAVPTSRLSSSPSAVMGLFGGIVSASLGALVIVSVAIAHHWTPALELSVALPAPLVGILRGLGSGRCPSWRAARLRPAVALRGGT